MKAPRASARRARAARGSEGAVQGAAVVLMRVMREA